MQERILKEAELICERMFPDDEAKQILLHHYLACFAELVEVVAVRSFRDELSGEQYKPEEVKFG